MNGSLGIRLTTISSVLVREGEVLGPGFLMRVLHNRYVPAKHFCTFMPIPHRYDLFSIYHGALGKKQSTLEKRLFRATEDFTVCNKDYF